MKSLQRIGIASGLFTGLMGTVAHFTTQIFRQGGSRQRTRNLRRSRPRKKRSVSSSGRSRLHRRNSRAAAASASATAPAAANRRRVRSCRLSNSSNRRSGPIRSSFARCSRRGRLPGSRRQQQQPQVRQCNPQFMPRPGMPGQPPQQPGQPPAAQQQPPGTPSWHPARRATAGAQGNPQFMPRPGMPGTPGQPPSQQPGQPPAAQQLPPGTPPGTPPGAQPPVRQGNPQFLPRPGMPGAPGQPPQVAALSSSSRLTPGFTPSRPWRRRPAPRPARSCRSGSIRCRANRQQRVIQGRTIITEPGNRTIIRQDNTRHHPQRRPRPLLVRRPRVRTAPRPRRDDADVLRAPRRHPRGDRDGLRRPHSPPLPHRPERARDEPHRQPQLLSQCRDWPGVGLLGAAIIYNLPRPRVDIPRERYIVDYDRASDDDHYEALTAPAVDARRAGLFARRDPRQLQLARAACVGGSRQT